MNRPRTCGVSAAYLLVGMLLLIGLAGGSAGVVDGPAEPSVNAPETTNTQHATELAFAVGDIEPDDVVLHVDVDDDGDATWRITYRTRLDTEDEEDAFDEFKADIEADPDAYTDRFAERMSATAEDASGATGREMAISGMSVTAERTSLPREYGIVTYTFQWSNFAAVDDDRLIVGDAIDGLFLDDASELRIGWTNDRVLTDANPTPTESTPTEVVWRGPVSFSAGEPRVSLDPAEPGGSDDGRGDGGDSPISDGALSATTLAGLVVLLLLVAGGYAGARGEISPRRLVGTIPGTRIRGETGTAENAAGADDTRSLSNDTATEDPTATTTDEDEVGSTAEGSIETGSDTEDEGESDPFGGVDPDLLSNEEKVLKLLEANDGRMKQKRVAEELGWTAAKTSQVTKRLREDEDLVGFRLGRENVLTLPEEDPR